jgi:hypothetical protein
VELRNDPQDLSAKAASTTPLRKPASRNCRGIQLTELFLPGEEHKIRLASQIGITYAFVGVREALSGVRRERYIETLAKIKARFQDAGMIFAGVESHPVAAEKIKLGLSGRDEEIENYVAAIRALADLGVSIVCYNWTAGLGWYRTRADVPGRGGALLSEFNNEEAGKQGITEWGEVSEDKIWSNRLWCKFESAVALAELHKIEWLEWAHAASAACHSSDIVALRPPNLPVLNCPFLIFSASSIPLIVIAAWSNRLNPSIGRIRCFTRRWSCSMRLFKYWLDRTRTRRGSSPASFISRTARCDAA